MIDQAASRSLKKRAIALPVIVLLAPASNNNSFGFNAAYDFTETTSGTINGFNRTTRAYTGIEIPKDRQVVNVIPDTEFNRQLVIRTLKAREEWRIVEGALNVRLIGAKVEAYEMIRPEHYEEQLQRVEEKHAKALKKDNEPGLP